MPSRESSVLNVNDQSKIQRRRYAWDCLHVFVLAQFGVAQPLLYRLSRKTVYLEDQGIDLGTLLLLIGFLCVIIPLALCVFEAGIGWISDKARARAHQFIVFVLFVLRSEEHTSELQSLRHL